MIYYYKEVTEVKLDVFHLQEVWQDGENVTNKLDLGKFFDSNKDVEKYISNVLGEDEIKEANPDTSPRDLNWKQ